MADIGEAIARMQHVDPGEFLYRGVTQAQIVPNGELNTYRPSSAAFKDVHGCLSVDIASKTSASASLRRLPKSIALAKFSAEIPISQGYAVVEDPISNCPGTEDNPAHALVLSKGEPIRKAHCRELARKCSWAIAPALHH
jgi:hypothetical protein